jgi:hypothetical protein
MGERNISSTRKRLKNGHTKTVGGTAMKLGLKREKKNGR